MDPGLLSWARSVRPTRVRGRIIPPLWLFTDSQRLPDPRPAIARLPKGGAGVVFRHDGAPDRLALGLDVARLCRIRRLVLVVAGDPRLAARLRAGQHLRGGRRVAAVAVARGVVTSSAHDRVELRRARRAGAMLVFLSPVFPTRSHPGGGALGPVRWMALARTAGVPVAALGGMDGVRIKRLPRRICRGGAAIGALASGRG